MMFFPLEKFTTHAIYRESLAYCWVLRKSKNGLFGTPKNSPKSKKIGFQIPILIGDLGKGHIFGRTPQEILRPASRE
jgi:hypothetical protein